MNIALYLFWRVKVPPDFKNWKNAIKPIYKAAMKKATSLDNLIFYSIRPFYATFYLSVLVEKPMELLRQHIKPGEVYRRSDLEYFSSAID